MSVFTRRMVANVLMLAMCAMSLYAGDAKMPAPPKAGFRAEVLRQLGDVQKKVEDLAAAIPADKYSWRPAEGVRSISEVYVHIAGSNYFFMTFLGIKPPMKMDPGMEKSVTDKAEIGKMMKPSFDHIRNAVLGLTDRDLDKTTEMFGSTSSYRNVLMTQLSHLHEHLGQSIAYARVNNVVPPWTAAEQAEAAKKDSK